MSMENGLREAFKFFKFEKGTSADMLSTLIRNAQLAILIKMKADLDKMIDNVSKIPGAPTQSVPDPFEVLGVSPNASKDEVKKAYRKKAGEAHPDRNPGKEEWANRQMMFINAAYEAIRRVRGWK